MAKAFSFSFAVTLVLASLSLLDAQRGGFTVDLIHRDSLKSPFYKPETTPYERLTNALRRSITRVSHFNPNFISPNAAQSDVISNNGEYLMNISLGTPPVEIHGIADTGSDLVWTQCKPCSDCYKQDAPLFDPISSSTYKDLSCSSRQCQNTPQVSCGGDETCLYTMSYGDKSFTNGNLAVDTLTLGSTNDRPVVLPKTVIGCGHHNDGTFNERGSGIVGLGGGPLSLISQLGTSIDGKFSYCLVPMTSDLKQTSKINFGTNGVVSGSGVVSTPIVKKDPDTFYYLTLEGVSINDKRVDFTSRIGSAVEGNIIIDSGTTLTLLPATYYSDLESAVAEAIDAERADDPSQTLSLCYSVSSSSSSDIKFPILTAHFTGADVKLSPLNTFVQISEGVVCFAFGGMSNSFGIFGNLAQMNYLVGYDSEAQTVSFKPTDCTKT